ncbi:MAG: hypothetical protein KGS72_27315 [Cyanobacteria bacterium REEB67]|nr:hypothetical protein [Cyanobacteria bacterium REEB67]
MTTGPSMPVTLAKWQPLLFAAVALTVLTALNITAGARQNVVTVAEVVPAELPSPEAESPTTEVEFGADIFRYFARNDRHGAYCQVLREGREVYHANLYQAMTECLPALDEKKAALAAESPALADDPLTGQYNVLPEPEPFPTRNHQPDLLQPVMAVTDANQLTSIHPLTVLPGGERQIVLETKNTDTSRHFSVIDLGHQANDTVREIAAFDSDKSLVLADIDNDKVYEFVASDVFDVWGHAPVCTQLAYRLEVAGKHAKLRPIKTPLEKIEQTSAGKARITNYSEEFAQLERTPGIPLTFAPANLAEEMVNLIYGGHEHQAKQLLDRVWPVGTGGKKAFYKALRNELKKSPNWPDVVALNKR